jgi:hypothetical protein
VRARGARSALRQLAVDHPGRAELIDQHAEAGGPERFLDRHPHGSVLGQGMKYPLRLRRIGDTESHGEALHVFRAAGGGIGTHQHLVAHDQASVHDLLAPFRRHMLLRGGAFVRKHRFDPSAENLLVELERRLAVALEGEVGIQLHHALLRLVGGRNVGKDTTMKSRSGTTPPAWAASSGSGRYFLRPRFFSFASSVRR